MRPETLITSAADLRQLSMQPWSALQLRQVRLGFGQVADAELRLWEKRLDDDLRECGCKLGGYFLSGGLLGVVVLTIAYWSFLRAAPVRALVLMLLTLVACAVAGKLIGLALARARFRRTIATITARIS